MKLAMADLDEAVSCLGDTLGDAADSRAGAFSSSICCLGGDESFDSSADVGCWAGFSSIMSWEQTGITGGESSTR